MTIGVNVWQVIARIISRQPVTEELPGVTAVGGFGSCELSAKIDSIARWIGGINENELIVKSLVTHQVHVGLPGIGSSRSLTVDAQRKPCLPPIERTEQIQLINFPGNDVSYSRCESINRRVAQLAYG